MTADLIRETETIDDVIGAMRRIDAALADDDGVKWFNFLYLSVTEAVRADAAAWQDWLSCSASTCSSRACTSMHCPRRSATPI